MDIPALEHLRDVPRDVLQEILGASDVSYVSHQVDSLRVVEYLAAHKPSLTELDFGSSVADVARRVGTSADPAHRFPAIVSAIAASFDGLQRLVLPRFTCPVDLACVAALSSKTKLRELKITHESGELTLTDQGLGALRTLASLEHLTLSCLGVGWRTSSNPSSEGDQAQASRLLQLLMGNGRPPRLHNLKVAGKVLYDEVDVQLSYGQQGQPPAQGQEAGLAAGAAGGLGSIISSMEVHAPERVEERLLVFLDALAGPLLGALDDLGQPAIPVLSMPDVLTVSDSSTFVRLLEAEAALPRLAARCERVGFKELVNTGRSSSSRAVLDIVRLFGWPEKIQLHHGEFDLQRALAAHQAAQQAAQQDGGRAPKRQKAGGQSAGQENQPPQQQPGQQAQGRALSLKDIKAKSLLRMALDQLWSQAVSEQTGGHGSGGGGQRAMVMLRASKLPPRPRPVEKTFEDLQGSKWQLWLDKFLRDCCSAGGGGRQGRHRQLLEYDTAHVVVAEEHTLLLQCDDAGSAEQLASMLGRAPVGGAGKGAAVLRVPFEDCAELLVKQVLQVLEDIWDQSAESSSRGRGGKRGGAAAAGSAAGGGAAGDEKLAALDRLLVLDAGVQQLWRSVPLPEAYEFPEEELYGDIPSGRGLRHLARELY